MDNRITDLSDSDFLSFLYAERDREESLNSYPGWSHWAIWGAVVTIFLAICSILKSHYGEVDLLNSGYLLSGILAFLLCYRPYFLFVMSIVSRERGVDKKKVKYLKDVAPKPYLWLALVIAVFFSVFIQIVDLMNSWNKVSIVWMIVALLNSKPSVNPVLQGPHKLLERFSKSYRNLQVTRPPLHWDTLSHTKSCLRYSLKSIRKTCLTSSQG